MTNTNTYTTIAALQARVAELEAEIYGEERVRINAEQRNGALYQRISELEADAARLDWCANHEISTIQWLGRVRLTADIGHKRPWFDALTLRHAIDVARAESAAQDAQDSALESPQDGQGCVFGGK